MSQASSSQKLPSPDSTDEQTERVLDLEETQQIANRQRAEQELQRGKGDVLNYKEGIQELDRQARQRWLDDDARRQTEKLAAVNKLKREKTEQRDFRGKLRA